jgi:general secretion pathway protein G
MSRQLVRRKNEEGFTLFELLIVIIILAILAGIVAFSVGSSRANAVGSSCQSDAKTFSTALEQYKAQVGSYPPLGPLPPSIVPYVPYTWLTSPQVVDGQTVGPFLRQMPGTANYQIETDGLGNVYVYPAGTAPNLSPTGMKNQTVQRAWNSSVSNLNTQMHLNYATNNGAICDNPYLSQAPSS